MADRGNRKKRTEAADGVSVEPKTQRFRPNHASAAGRPSLVDESRAAIELLKTSESFRAAFSFPDPTGALRAPKHGRPSSLSPGRLDVAAADFAPRPRTGAEVLWFHPQRWASRSRKAQTNVQGTAVVLLQGGVNWRCASEGTCGNAFKQRLLTVKQARRTRAA